MNKTFYLSSFFALYATFSLAPLTVFADEIACQEASCMPSTIHHPSYGQKWVEAMLKAYHNEKFETRLAMINAEVQRGIEEDRFEEYEIAFPFQEEQEFLNISETEQEFLSNSEAEKEMEEIKLSIEPFIQALAQLQEQCQEVLLQAAIAYPESEIIHSINNYIELCNSYEERYPAYNKFINILSSNKAISFQEFRKIVKNYRLKRYVILLLKTNTQLDEDSNNDYPIESLANQYTIDSFLIRYEELVELLKVAEMQANNSLVILIKQSIKEFKKNTAKRYDRDYLRLLGNGTMSPSDFAEEQIAEIMSRYQGQKMNLLEAFYPSTD